MMLLLRFKLDLYNTKDLYKTMLNSQTVFLDFHSIIYYIEISFCATEQYRPSKSILIIYSHRHRYLHALYYMP